jgi:3-deoxy-D-manno-octulosonic-acid transferase
LHAVSVGETRAAETLLRALAILHPDAQILMTHMTPGGRDAARRVYGDLMRQGRLASVYLPYDVGFAVRRFLRTFEPSFGMLMETEIWPTLMAECAVVNLPVALVNARLSARSAARGMRLGSLMRNAAARIAVVVAQTPDDATRIAAFGGTDPVVAGNLKFDVPPSASMMALGRTWRDTTGSRRVVVLAATRESRGMSEEALLLDAWEARSARDPVLAGAMLVIVPRHSQRFDEVFRLMQSRAEKSGQRIARRSATPPRQSVDLWLGDSMGEMAAYYTLAHVAIIGGSLLPLGGQNLIEACACHCPVVLGPHTYNFEQVAEQAVQAGAAVRAADAEHAVELVAQLLAKPRKLEAQARLAQGFALDHAGATLRTLEALEPLRAQMDQRPSRVST